MIPNSPVRQLWVACALLVFSVPAHAQDTPTELRDIFVDIMWEKSLHLICSAMYTTFVEKLGADEPEGLRLDLEKWANDHSTLAYSYGATAEEATITRYQVALLDNSLDFSTTELSVFLYGSCLLELQSEHNHQ